MFPWRKKVIPYSAQEKEEQANVLTMLDPAFLSNAGFALEQADKAVGLLAETSGEAFSTVTRFDASPEHEREVALLCGRTEQFRDQIEAYLTKLSGHRLQQSDAESVAMLLRVSASFARIGAVSGKILDLFQKVRQTDDPLTDTDRLEARVIGSAIQELIDVTITGFESRSVSLPSTIRIYRELIGEITETVKKRHIRRMHLEGGRREFSTLFTDICYTEEQLVDECDAIADTMLKYAAASGGSSVPAENTAAKRAQIYALFEDKYRLLQIELPER